MARAASVVELLLQERRAELRLERKLGDFLQERRAELPQEPPHELRQDLAWVGYRYLVELTERGRRALEAEQDHIEDGRE